MAAPSSRDMARLKPRPMKPRKAVAMMVRGMATASSRQVEPQRRQPSGRSSFSPAPIRLIRTTSSASRSVKVSQVRGSGSKDNTPVLNTTTPMATHNMARVSGQRFSPTGAQDTIRITAPRPSRNRT